MIIKYEVIIITTVIVQMIFLVIKIKTTTNTKTKNKNLKPKPKTKTKIRQNQTNIPSVSFQNRPNRGIHNNQAWTTRQSHNDEDLQRPHLFVTIDLVLNTSTMPQLRRMSLSLDNDLPAARIRFGSSDKDEVAITCYLDSFTAINTVNSLLHM